MDGNWRKNWKIFLVILIFLSENQKVEKVFKILRTLSLKFKSTLDSLRTLVYWIQDYSILFSIISP